MQKLIKLPKSDDVQILKFGSNMLKI